MKFVNKGAGQPYFCVEDYTPEQKEFFESIGFKETKPNVTPDVAKAFKLKGNLNFQGSEMFGLWSKKQMKDICKKIYDKFPEIEQIEVEEMNPYE